MESQHSVDEAPNKRQIIIAVLLRLCGNIVSVLNCRRIQSNFLLTMCATKGKQANIINQNL